MRVGREAWYTVGREAESLTRTLIALKLIKTLWMVFVVEEFIWEGNSIIGCNLE